MLTQTQIDRRNALAAYRLRCFGAIQLHDAAGVDCTPRGRKTRALLVYVLLARGEISRNRLASLLWADHGDEQARASVRQALYELKPLSTGSAPLLRITRTHVSANDIEVAFDLDQADSLAQAEDLDALTELLACTPLTLFADLDDLTPDFDDWLRAERLQRTERLIGLCVAAGQAALARQQHQAVRSLVATLESLDPLNEPLVRLGMQADTQCGDHAQAHRRYRRFAERLERDLSAHPSAETRALLAKQPVHAVSTVTNEIDIARSDAPFGDTQDNGALRRDAPAGNAQPSGSRSGEDGSISAPTRIETPLDTRPRAWARRFKIALAAIIVTFLIATLALGVWRLTARPVSSRPSASEIYARAEALMRDRREPDLSRARTLLLEATESEPAYAPAWASLAIVTMLLSDQSMTYGPIPLAQARDQALHYANRAVALNPNLAQAHAALGLASIVDVRAIPHYLRAIELDPNRAEYHRWLGQAYEAAGRHHEAFEQFQLSLAAEPRWATSVTIVMNKLEEMGRGSEIEDLVRRFAGVSKTPYDRGYVQYIAHHLRGELQAMVVLGRDLLRSRSDDEKIAFSMATTLAALGDRASALAVLQPNEVLFRAIVGHDVQRIERLARESPGIFWHSELDDARAGELLVASGRGKLLLELFDARYGDMAHVEALPHGLMTPAPAVIVALRDAGRVEEAAKLNRLALDSIRLDLANGVSPRVLAFEQAQQLALAGDSAGALAELEQLMQNRWTDLLATPFVGLTERVAFRDLHTDPRLLALQQQLDEHIRVARDQIGAL